VIVATRLAQLLHEGRDLTLEPVNFLRQTLRQELASQNLHYQLSGSVGFILLACSKQL
jgi:hypothetical protein